jgi:hypothetical protein
MTLMARLLHPVMNACHFVTQKHLVQKCSSSLGTWKLAEFVAGLLPSTTLLIFLCSMHAIHVIKWIRAPLDFSRSLVGKSHVEEWTVLSTLMKFEYNSRMTIVS